MKEPGYEVDSERKNEQGTDADDEEVNGRREGDARVDKAVRPGSDEGGRTEDQVAEGMGKTATPSFTSGCQKPS